MKQLLLILLFIPAWLSAQTDQRYLAGAVPMKDGKVVFTKEISVPAHNQDQIYDTMLNWAKENFNTEERRVVFENKEEGSIAIVSKEYIVFTNTALSLDRSLTTYRLIIDCKDQLCQMEIGGIRYSYDVTYQKEPETYLAEKWITDDIALNGKKNKLNRIAGKFRKGTIDLVDQLFASATNALGVQMLSEQTPIKEETTPTEQVKVTPVTPTPTNTPKATSTSNQMEGFVAFEPDKVPNTIIQMLPDNSMSVSADAKTTAEGNATWKGFGNMFGKSIATISINPESATYKAIGEDGTFRLSFSKDKEPWFIIECKKQGETADGQQKVVIGEVLHIWIK